MKLLPYKSAEEFLSVRYSFPRASGSNTEVKQGRFPCINVPPPQRNLGLEWSSEAFKM